MNRYNTIVILDWDDTLFPTSWISNNNIDISDEDVRMKYRIYFSELDNIVYNLLTDINKYSRIVIVTNASLKWFYSSVQMLPNSEGYIRSNIPIISARDLHSYNYPLEPNKWKVEVYNSLIQPIINTEQVQNIISVGDGPSEFYALTNLAFNNNKDIYYKTIRLVGNPTIKQLLEQIKIMNINIANIVFKKEHLDLVFGNRNIVKNR